MTKNPGDKNRQPPSPTIWNTKVTDSPNETVKDASQKPLHYSPKRRLTENERRICHEYDPSSKTSRDILKGKKLMNKYNGLDEEDQEGKQKLLDEFLNPACRGKQLFIEQPFYTLVGYNLTVGQYFFSNINCFIEDAEQVTIGDNCMLGPGVHIYTGTHPVDAMARREYGLWYPVKIGSDVWIGGGSVVCPGVTIGDNVTVAAGSIVAEDIPSNVVIGGNPAKILRNLDPK